jgi:hypothetical protein
MYQPVLQCYIIVYKYAMNEFSPLFQWNVSILWVGKDLDQFSKIVSKSSLTWNQQNNPNECMISMYYDGNIQA